MNFSPESFNDAFDIFEELGKGHFAVVRRCVNKETNQEYAAKIIRKKRVCRGVPMEDIKREMETLSRLHHPNIVELHQVYDTGQTVILMLELITGGELFNFIEEQPEGRLTELQSIHVTKQILAAVSHMHQIYLAHLDLKPENILLVEKCEYPTIKVIDFGLAQQLDAVAEIKTVFGTPEFVAPEVVNFDVLSLATDMWAIGVIVYILISGASPFLGETKQETYSNVASGTFSFDKEYFENVSAEAKDFINRLLVKDPRGRDTVWASLEHPWVKTKSSPSNAMEKLEESIIKIKEEEKGPVYLSIADTEEGIETVEDILSHKEFNLLQTDKEIEHPEETRIIINNDEVKAPVCLSVVEAVETGRTEAVEDALSQEEFDLLQTNKNGETCMHVAARMGNLAIARILVSAGASVTEADSNGETPLLHAARHGHVDMLQYLIATASCLATPNKEGENALHVACAWGHNECVSLLVESGMYVDAVNNYNASPLHIALYRRNSEIALYLLHTAAADFELQDAGGDTALHLAAREGLLSVVQALCSLNCTVDIANRNGLYPVHFAARHGHAEIVRCLCLAGCNTEQKNGDGIKAEITAIKHGHNDISYLLSKVKNSATREAYVRQLLPLKEPVPRVNIQLFGHSGVGKSTLVETLKAGYFSSFFRRHRASPLSSNSASSTNSISNGSTAAVTRSQPGSPSKIHIEMDLTSRQNSLNFDLYNYHYTRGIDVQQVTIPVVGDVTVWDFSGQDTYFTLYHHLITSDGSNAILVIVFNMEDTPTIQLRQCCFWLSFLQARIPPNEPIGLCGRTANTAHVMLVGTHADKAASRNAQGEYCSLQAQALVKQLQQKYYSTFDIHPNVVVLDAQAANSLGIKQLRTCLSQIRSKLVQVVPNMTGFCSAVLSWLPILRKSAATFPVLSWDAFMDMTRTQVNPLATNSHMRELLSQLLHMGEVVYLKSGLHPHLLVINPTWLCGQIIGQLLSIDFIAQARITGCYTGDDFQAAFPEADSIVMLQVLETLRLCVQSDNDDETEYEFPCYNLGDAMEGVWDDSDLQYKSPDSCYGGVRLHTPPGTVHLMHSVFPCIQVELRGCDPENDLYQWFRGSKLSSGMLEALITLHEEQSGADFIEIKVRGPPQSSVMCFFLIEEILSIIDQVLLEMNPGLAVEKHVLSAADLRNHAEPPHCFSSSDLMRAILEPTGLDTSLYNPLADCHETLRQLVAFDDREVECVMICADQLSVNCLSSVHRQALCSILDPQDPLGKDWCLLALQLGLADRVPVIEGSQNSPTATLLDIWASNPKHSSSIGELIRKLESFGRDDGMNILLRGAPLYRISQHIVDCPDTPSISSRNVSR